ncbi:hypothetical protein HHK36_023030 [Tetracentron sinense]|uniref:SBP-type domain-containing protein n=1 Tax=Tetracentron sinense TaxID=13715 RepID=A0A834YSZ4_TETSI|nr:hypothetical protein HHK36_023030 [Tetracentron sinense]
METKIGGEAQYFYTPGLSDMKRVGKKSVEWDLNDWKWDGDLFIASQVNSVPSDYRSSQLFPVGSGDPSIGGLSNSSSSLSDETNPGSEKAKKELEKRRRVVVIEDDDLNDEAGSLTLKLGGHGYPITEVEAENWDGINGKKAKLLGATSNRAVCQVEDCRADLSNSKDYHRRHKVCSLHSKASEALVGNIMQRFCQQCSRFHVLQEFDEGKRSCRRRLAGHNKRRRKTHPDASVNGTSVNDDRANSYLLISLLRILSNMHWIAKEIEGSHFLTSTVAEEGGDLVRMPTPNCNAGNKPTMLRRGEDENNEAEGPGANSSNQPKDEDLISHLLRNLASLASTIDGRNLSGLQESKDKLNVGTSAGISEMIPSLLSNGPEPSRPFSSTSKINCSTGPQGSLRPTEQYFTVATSEMPQKGIITDDARSGALQTALSPKSIIQFPIKDSLPAQAEAPGAATGRIKLNNFDLNNIYDESEDLEGSRSTAHLGIGSLDCPSWVLHDSHQSSPPQTSRNSDSASAQSPSSSNGDAQIRTDRIVFKLFGKYPNDFPLVLRAQILDWLSHSPTDIESYIRPGCIILTIYLRLAESTWQELCCDLGSSLSRLLDVSNDTFWRTGWVYARVQHQIAFIYNGQVVLDTSLPLKIHNHCRISSVKPIAVSVSEKAQFSVKGFNLSRPTRLLCALEGTYLVEEATHEVVDGADTFKEHDELQCLSFPCSIPNVIGRGFIEVEDNGLGSGFFPFIVAEQDVCSEICMLESAIEVVETDDDIQGRTGKMEAKNQALDFIHEMGWLLHRSHLKSRLDHMDPNLGNFHFHFKRFRWLMEFSMDHDWCAVVKKLLEILLEGNVDTGEYPSVELALSEMGLLHRAVRRNCRHLVEFLLRYVPDKSGSEQKQQVDRSYGNFLFKPDAVGPAGLTPLHIAAGRDGSENVLDALTDDPGLVGIEAWKSACDSTGFTPEDYARLRGHYSYIHMVQKKINKKSEARHVVLDIPGALSEYNNPNQKQMDVPNSAEVSGFQIERTELRPIKQQCKLCNQKLAYGKVGISMAYRPAMLSMVAIAAICVCVALFFKSSPEVLVEFGPFRWELLDYGFILVQRARDAVQGSKVMASLSLSFSSSLRPSSLFQDNNNNNRTRGETNISRAFRCAFASPVRKSASSSSSVRTSPGPKHAPSPKKRHWKEGEFPGTSDTSLLNPSRTPIRNLKKKIDKKNNAKAWVNTVTESLSELIQKKQWQEALAVFEMLKEQPFYQPKEGTYMKLLVLLGKYGQPQRAHQLFDTMVEEGCEPTAELYTALLAAYCRSNLIDEAFKILNLMKTLPLCQPDVFTYSTLIKACIDAARFELVDSLYEEMADRLITPNTVTQNIVLNGYGKAGKFDQMEKVLLGMLESTTCKPDVWTMNTILSLFGNKGQIEMMERWYEKFRSFGIEPETRTFNILIGAYGKKRMYDKMSSVMEYMRKLSFPWTTSTYNNVIEAFADVGDAKHMEYTFDQMRAEDMKADTKTFCCLIYGYANAGLFHKVVSSVQLAGKFEIPENTSFYNAVISACAKAEDLIEMERVFKRMKEKHCPPDSSTYSIMVEAYKKEGMNDKIYDLEQEKQNMVANGLEDD